MLYGFSPPPGAFWGLRGSAFRFFFFWGGGGGGGSVFGGLDLGCSGFGMYSMGSGFRVRIRGFRVKDSTN